MHVSCICFVRILSVKAVYGETQRASKRQRDEGMRRWSRERERWPVEPFCHDWKRQWALTSVGGFGLSPCLLVHPCGIRESKMNTLTHFLPFLPVLLPSLPLSTPSPLTLFFGCSMTCRVNRYRDHLWAYWDWLLLINLGIFSYKVQQQNA